MEIKDLNNIDRLKAIEAWQDADNLHPLTCVCGLGMYGDVDIESKIVFLRCPKGHIQEKIPKVVLTRYIIENNLKER